MPAWIYVLAVAAVLFVAWFGFARRWWHSLRYSWQQARHLADLTQTELIPGAEYGSMNLDDDPNGPAITELLRRYEPSPDGPGGVDWDILPAPLAVGWRERTAAELSPEALGSAHIDPRAIRHCPEHDAAICIHNDPGPGGAVEPSSASPAPPGPDQDPNGGPTVSGPEGAEDVNAPPVRADWLDVQLADLFTWVRAMHESRVTA